MIVDGERFIRVGLASLLGKEGNALRLLSEYAFDLVFIESHVMEIDGMPAYIYSRERPEYRGHHDESLRLCEDRG